MKRHVIDCDHCGVRAPLYAASFTVTTERHPDNAGDMDEEQMTVDLCVTCQEIALRELLDRLDCEARWQWARKWITKLNP